MKIRFGPIAFGAAVLAASSLSAQTTLVSWGLSSDYVTASLDSPRPRGGGVVSFDMSTPLSPALASGYTGSTFYGGVNGSPSLNGGFGVYNNRSFMGNYDAIQISQVSPNVAAGNTLVGVVMWKQADFLAGADASTSSITVESVSYTAMVLNASSTANELRLVLQQGSSYIISSNLGLNKGFVEARTIGTLSSVSWYAYTPSATLSLLDIGAQISSPSFSGVTAAGFLATAQATNSTDALSILTTQFTVTGTVSAIPEPASAAVLVAFGALAVAGARRRKRCAPSLSIHE